MKIRVKELRQLIVETIAWTSPEYAPDAIDVPGKKFGFVALQQVSSLIADAWAELCEQHADDEDQIDELLQNSTFWRRRTNMGYLLVGEGAKEYSQFVWNAEGGVNEWVDIEDAPDQLLYPGVPDDTWERDEFDSDDDRDDI